MLQTASHFLQDMPRESVLAPHYSREFVQYALSEDDILYAANDGEMFVPPDTSSNLSYDDIIDFRDFAAFALQWPDSCPE